MKKEPLVCVCLLSYNTAETIGETLSSILAQTYKNIVVKVIDNHSTDSSREVVERAAAGDPRVRFFSNAENVGGPGNYVKAIEASEGEYTAVFHSDDIYSPDIIRREVEYLESHPRAGAVFTEAVDIDHTGSEIGLRATPKDLPPADEYGLRDLLKALLKKGNFLMCPTAMVRTRIYKDEVMPLEPFPYKTSTDLGMWLKIAEKNTIGIIREPLIKYRLSTHSFSFKHVRTRTVMQDMFLTLDDYSVKYADQLSALDMRNYRLLMYRERVDIAINLIISGDSHKARGMLFGLLFSFRDLLDAVLTPWFYKYLAIASFAFVLSVLPIGGRGREMLFSVRHGV